MINKSIFKAYDVRGIYPTDVNPETIELIGRACVKMFGPGEIILAYDARHGSPELCAVLEKTLLEESQKTNIPVTIKNIGFATTPMFYFLVNHFKAVGGCMITASHNPKNYNGVKIVKEGAIMASGLDVLKVIESLS